MDNEVPRLHHRHLDFLETAMGFLFALGFPLLLAQAPAAPALRGTISDEATGEPITGALVELLDVARRTYSDTAGRFELSDVPPGSHDLRVSRLGYASRTVDVLLPAGVDLQVDVGLAALPATLVRVRVLDSAGGSPFARDDSADAGAPGLYVVTAEDVRSHPLLAEPDFLMALSGNAGVAIAPEAPTSIHVRGGAGDQNLVLFDGVPVYSPVHASGSFGALNPDALEAVALHAGVLPARLGGALSSVIEARSRVPDLSGFHARGGMGLTSARLTVEGPLSGTRAGYLVSGRWGAPALFAGPQEETRLRSESRDVLAKITTAFVGGRLEAFSFTAGDQSGFSSRVPDGTAMTATSTSPAARHAFEWGSRTHALSWRRSLRQNMSLALSSWHADYEAEIEWIGASMPLSVSSARATTGLQGSVSVDRPGRWLRLGLDATREDARYAVAPHSAPVTAGHSSYAVDGRATMISAFVDDRVQLGRGWHLMTGARGTMLGSHTLLLEPRVALVTQLVPSVTVALGVSRVHQPVQSLTNPESPVRNVFGGVLPVLAGASAPVARSDQVAATITATPRPGLRVTIDAYAKALDGLALIAPVSSRPFAADTIATGRGRVVGLGAAAAWRAARLAGTTALGFTHSISRTDRGSYRPNYTPALSLSTGLAYQSSAQMTWRAALMARSGQRVTRYQGPLLWEGCDPIDGGCEMMGTPERTTGALGAERLPGYLRLDLGVRRAWRIPRFGPAGALEAYGTVSNVLGRRNVWALLAEPDTGTPSSVPMRPFSLLTAGIDWRF
jgi:hypothetical protein